MLVGFDPAETWEAVLYRFERMRERAIHPYPMPYGDKHRTLPLGRADAQIVRRHLTLKDFQRWAIRVSKLNVPFAEYDVSARGWARDRPPFLF